MNKAKNTRGTTSMLICKGSCFDCGFGTVTVLKPCVTVQLCLTEIGPIVFRLRMYSSAGLKPLK